MMKGSTSSISSVGLWFLPTIYTSIDPHRRFFVSQVIINLLANDRYLRAECWLIQWNFAPWNHLKRLFVMDFKERSVKNCPFRIFMNAFLLFVRSQNLWCINDFPCVQAEFMDGRSSCTTLLFLPCNFQGNRNNWFS